MNLNFPEPVREYCRSHYGYTEEQMLARFNGRAEQTVKELMPELHGCKIETMMDIGCGLGATTAALARAVEASHVHLVEANERRPITASGFNQELKPWNDVHVSQIMVEANVPPHVAVYPHDSDAFLAIGSKTVQPLDLITSFRSWCHHYPVETYLDVVKSLLKLHTGRLVVDVRTATNGMKTLEAAGFQKIAYVSQHSASLQKTGRYVFRLEKWQ